MKILAAVINCSFLLASIAYASSLQEQNKALAKRAFEELLSGDDSNSLNNFMPKTSSITGSIEISASRKTRRP